jgi:MFS family permease
MSENTRKKNYIYIFGILLLTLAMQFANYGSAVCVSGDIAAMGATDYYVLISACGCVGMMLILPIVGRLTGMIGMKKLILIGIIVQLAGRIIMDISGTWVPYMLGQIVQSLGGGLYVSAAFVLMAGAVEPHERAKYFGYIAVANAIGAVFGPIIISMMYSAGGFIGKLALCINAPLAIIAWLLILKECPNTKVPGAGKNFDYLGLIETVIALTCFVFILNLGGKMFAWVSVPCLGLAVIMVVAFVLMFKRETSIENPAVPLKMFKNSRLTYAFIGSLVAAAYSTCSGSYCVMWIRTNYQGLATSTFFNGTGTMAQQIVIFILGLFIGGYIGKKFTTRFRTFGILSMACVIVACGILYCLKFTGTAAEGNLVMLSESFPAGMLLIYAATAIGGFTSVVSQSSFSAFYQSNTPREDIPAAQALYTIGSTGGSAIFGAVVGVVLGTSGDFTRAFALGIVFGVIGLIAAIVGFVFSPEEIAAEEARSAR